MSKLLIDRLGGGGFTQNWGLMSLTHSSIDVRNKTFMNLWLTEEIYFVLFVFGRIVFSVLFYGLAAEWSNESFWFWVRVCIIPFRTRVGTIGCNSCCICMWLSKVRPTGSCLVGCCIVLSLQGIDTIIFPILHLVYGSSSKLLFILYSEPYCEFIILPAKLYRSHIADVGFFLVYNVDWIIRNVGGGGE